MEKCSLKADFVKGEIKGWMVRCSRMSKCGFCESLMFHREQDERQKDDRFRENYFVKLYIETERDLERKGEWIDCGTLTCGKSPLNYCLECGRKLK